MTKRRSQSATDRDLASPGRRERAKSPAVQYVEPESTDQCETPEELTTMRTLRASRDPAGRIAILEANHRELDATVSKIAVAVADIRGDQKAQNASLTAITKTLDRMAARADVQHAADVDVQASEKKDAITARAEKRALVLKAAGLLLSGGVIGKVGNMLGWW